MTAAARTGPAAARAIPEPRAEAAPARIAGFDLARGIAVVAMIAVHVQRHWGAAETVATPVGALFTLAGGPLAAPVFMLLMGASTAWSRRTGTGALVRRGLVLLAGGYLLNLARGPLAIVAGQALGVVGPDGRVGPYDAWWVATMVDILQLAGIALVAIALLRRVLPTDPLPWVAAGVLAVLVAPLVAPLRTGSELGDAAIAVLWAATDPSYYPALPWLVFPLVGVGYGSAVRRAADPFAEQLRWATVGVALAIVGGALILVARPVLDAPVYWELPIWLLPGILGIVLPWLAACSWLAARLDGHAPVRFLHLTGRRVTRIYVAHWLVVAWGLPFVGYLALPMAPMLAAVVGVTAVAHGLVELSLRLPAPLGARRVEVRGPRTAGSEASGPAPARSDGGTGGTDGAASGLPGGAATGGDPLPALPPPGHPLRLTTIAHLGRTTLSPLDPPTLEALLDLAGTGPGDRVLDVGCGKGELLVLAARRGADATGIDRNPWFAAEALELADRYEVGDRVTVDAGDADGLARDGAWDLVACIGASGALGGPVAAPAALAALVRPGGLVLLGEGHLRRAVTAEELASLGIPEGELLDLPATIARMEAPGLVTVDALEAGAAEWDRYEDAYARALEAWAGEHPDDPDAAAALERAVRFRATWEGWRRDAMGFVVVLLRRQGPGHETSAG